MNGSSRLVSRRMSILSSSGRDTAYCLPFGTLRVSSLSSRLVYLFRCLLISAATVFGRLASSSGYSSGLPYSTLTNGQSNLTSGARSDVISESRAAAARRSTHDCLRKTLYKVNYAGCPLLVQSLGKEGWSCWLISLVYTQDP